MDVFDLRQRLVDDYADFTRSFVNIHDRRIADHVDRELAEGLLWPEPIVQLNPALQQTESVSPAPTVSARCRWARSSTAR